MAELYLFNDNGEYHAFTPTIFSKTLNGITYTPTIIVRSSLSLTDNLAKSSITFKFERTHTYAKTLLLDFPEYPIKVSIYRDGVLYWSGRVIETKANSLTIEVACDSIYSSTARAGLTNKISLNCRHTLYSANCGLVKESLAVSYNVSNLSSKTISLLTSQSIGYFKAGMAVINGQSRNILSHTSSTIVLSSAFTGVQSGTLTLYPGCSLNMASCTSFNNFDNFGGFPFIPSKNPFGSTGAL
jgi:hypothetical protein